MFQTQSARLLDESIRGHPARRVGEGGDHLTKRLARRMLVAAVAFACALMLIGVAAAPAEAGWCLIGKHVTWPKGMAPDANGNGQVCYNPRSGIYTDDGTGPRPN